MGSALNIVADMPALSENKTMKQRKRANKGRAPPTILGKGLDTIRELCWYNRIMPEATCPKCGTYYQGWALLNPRHQTCSRCGVALDITAPGHKVAKGYSPFTADKLVIKPPADTSPSLDKEQDKPEQKKQPSP